MNVYFFQFKGTPCVRARKAINSFINKGYNVTYIGVDRNEKVVGQRLLKIKHIGIKTNRGSIFKIFTLPVYSILSFLFIIKRIKKNDIVYATDLDAALGIFLGSFFKKNFIFIYDVLDTYADRYEKLKAFSWLLRKLESCIFQKADIPIHVDISRANTLNTFSKKFLIVHNKPSINDLMPLKKNFNMKTKNTFKILFSGGIYKHRGALNIIEAIDKLTGKGLNIELDIIGFGTQDIIEFSKKKFYVKYHGYVNSDTAQRFAYESDLILCLYDPSSAINKLASPNKVYDAVSNCSLALVNEEIINDTVHKEKDNIIYCQYDNIDSIAVAIEKSYKFIKIKENQEKLYNKAKFFRETGLWENEFKKVFDILDNS